MKISTRIGINSYLIYTASLGKKTDRKAYIDLLESMGVSSEVDNSSRILNIKGNKIASLPDSELIRIGKEIIKAENLLEYYNQLTHQDDFFYEFKETYNMYLKKAFEPVEKTFGNYGARLSNVVTGMASSFLELKHVMASIAKPIDIERLGKKVNKAKCFNKYANDLDWFPTAVGNKLSLNDVIQIVEMYETEGKEKTKEVVDRLFVQLYGVDEINRLYAGWVNNSRLKSRLPILRDGIDAHLGKHFYSSVCTILPQIEGIIHDIIPMTVKKIHQSHLEKKVAAIVDSKDFNQGTKKFYFEIILDNFDHGDEIPILSRHAILHGEDTNFGTEVKSLKLILLFDFLQEKIAKHKID